MITLDFVSGRSNSESVVIMIQQNIKHLHNDFVRVGEHGISLVELKGDNLTLSSAGDEISYKDVYVYENGQQVLATEFTIKPTDAQLALINESLAMEFVVNSTERIAFVKVNVT